MDVSVLESIRYFVGGGVRSYLKDMPVFHFVTYSFNYYFLFISEFYVIFRRRNNGEISQRKLLFKYGDFVITWTLNVQGFQFQ